MTYYSISRNSCEGTLADLLGAVEQETGLTKRQRQDRCSAIRILGRVIGRPLNTIPANIRVLRSLMEKIAPARHNLSARRWANIRSLVLKSLEKAQIPHLPPRSTVELSQAWHALFAQIRDQSIRIPLSAFARRCSAHDIDPEQVNQDVFDQYERDLEELGWRPRPRVIYLATCRAWNRLAEQCPQRQLRPVTVEDRRDWYSLPWSSFPKSLQDDINAMVAEAVSPDPVSPTSRKPIKPVSAETRRRQLRSFASALVHRGRSPDTITCIADLIEIEAAKEGLRFLLERAAQKPTPHVHQMAKLLCTLARHWVGVPPEHLGKLSLIRNHLNPGRHGMTEKNRATLRQFEDEKLSNKFLITPTRVAHQLKRKRKLTYIDAVRFRTAVATELLIVAPVRSQNLVQIDIERNLIEVGSGRSRRVHLHFPKSAVKNDTEIEFVLPKSTVELLDYYLEHVRPHFIRIPNSYLFPGRGRLHLAGPALSVQIADFVEKEVGIRLTPHQFRHLAGFFYLKENPAGHEVVRQLLGHKSIETTIQFYAGMETAEAIKHYDQHIARRRACVGRTDLPRGGVRV